MRIRLKGDYFKFFAKKNSQSSFGKFFKNLEKLRVFANFHRKKNAFSQKEISVFLKKIKKSNI